jgi:hypothetical protein
MSIDIRTFIHLTMEEEILEIKNESILRDGIAIINNVYAHINFRGFYLFRVNLFYYYKINKSPTSPLL